MTVIISIAKMLKSMDINARKMFIKELKNTGGLNYAEELELRSLLGMKDDFIGDAFIRMETAIKKAANEGVSMPKDVRKYNTEELRQLDIQIEEGNSIAQLAAMRGISPHSMRSVLELNGRQTLEGRIVSSITDEELLKLINEGKSPTEIAEYFGLEKAGSLTPRLAKLNYTTIKSKIDNIPDSYFIEAFNLGKKPSILANELGVIPKYVCDKYKALNLATEKFAPTQEQLQWISELFAKGYSRVEIARKLGIKSSQVAKIISENCMKSPKELALEALPKGNDLMQIMKNAISWRDLANDLKCSEKIVKAHLEREGLKFVPARIPSAQVFETIKQNPEITINKLAEILNTSPELIYKIMLKYAPTELNYSKTLPELVQMGCSPAQISELLDMPKSAVINEIETAIRKAKLNRQSINPMLSECLSSTKVVPTKQRFMSALEKARTKIDKINFYHESESVGTKIIDEMCSGLGISVPTFLQLLLKYNNGNIDYTLKTLLKGHPALGYYTYDVTRVNRLSQDMFSKLQVIKSNHSSEKYFC